MNRCDSCVKTDNLVLKALYSLDDRRLTVILLRFGEGLDRIQVGKKFHVTRNRIEEIEVKALAKIEHYGHLLGISITPELLRQTIQNNTEEIPFFKLHTRHEVDIDAIRNKRREGIAVAISSSNATEDATLPPLQHPLEELVAWPIDNLELSVRAHNCLMNSGITTIGQLLEKTEEDILSIINLGLKAKREIVDTLRSMGLSLKRKG